MADIISSIASSIAGYLVAPIGRQLGYLFNYHSNVDDVKNQVEKLGDMRGRVERDVDAASRNGDEIEPDVEKWLKNVTRVVEEAGKFLDDEDKANKKCLNGLCPNLKLRYQLSKKAKKTAEVVVKIQDGGKFDRVSYRAPLQGRIFSTFIKDYEAFESRMLILEEIMEALRNPNSNMIGVYGMGGVGKTMLAKEIARKAKEDKLFDAVVMAVVSQPPNIRKIQEEIAYGLGLRFDDQESDFSWVDRLYGRLKEEKSILVILDDIWAKLDLEAIGIPFGEVHKGCKILLTSRRRDVLIDEMNTQKNFGIGELLEEEAWDLFKKMAGDSVEAPHLKPTALMVAKECAGLPIAVVVVASALKNKSLPVWEDALQQLRSSAPTNIKGMDAKVYLPLKLSYDYLESEEAKSLFLLCSLFPEDYQFSILDFLKYGKGLGLFQGIDTLEKARNRVHTLADHLKSCCLLLDGDTSGLVRMHDVVRDVGISVASKDKHMLIVRNSVEFEEWTTDEKLRPICPAISLPFSDIHELPIGLECPELKFFLLFSDEPSLKIPDTIFEGMKPLKALNLTNISLSSLPSSLLFLTNLRTLCLDLCVLQDIAIIGELKKLEILSFRSSDIKMLPREIGQLTHLKLLDLSDCSELTIIPANVIASLSRLEDLYMGNSFAEWEVDGYASLAELKHLSCLVTLEIHILDANILSKDLVGVFQKLIRYQILVGECWEWAEEYETSRTLKLQLSTSSCLLFEINMLLKTAENFHLLGFIGIPNVFYDLDEQGFPHLKHLHVEGSSEIEYVINTMTRVPHSAFPNLESLELRCLINLKEICCGQFPPDSFCNLRTIKVEACYSLTDLFSLSVARSLLQLQEINIRHCMIMEAIFAEGREGDKGNNKAMETIMFPQLRSLTLEDVQKLISFCSKVKTVPILNYTPSTDAGSKEIISESQRDVPIPFFNEKVVLANLEKLIIKSASFIHLWYYQLPAGSFCKLKYLRVDNCPCLISNIVPSNMLLRLQNLESLEVYNCYGSLEYIFDLGGLNDTKRHAVRATQLRYLDLYRLGSLIHIWKMDSPGIFPFQNLSSLKVYGCHCLRSIFTTSMAKSLVQLQKLSISQCDEMKEIIEKEGVEEEEEATDVIVFPQVRSLSLQSLPQLKSFCQGIHISEWPSLEELRLSSCEMMEIFASELSSLKETGGKGHLGTSAKQPLFLADKDAFPNLKKMIFVEMSSLEEIWQGQFHARSFCKLRVLKVTRCDKILKLLPLSLLRNLQNLNQLSVNSCSSLEEVFELKGVLLGERGHDSILPQLKKLELTKLPKLVHLWRNDSQLCPLFQNLRTLEVRSCGSLTHLLPSRIAESLVEIESIIVDDCKMMKEIIVSDNGEAIDEISFNQLNSLELRGLLNKVWVKKCPNLKTSLTKSSTHRS